MGGRDFRMAPHVRRRQPCGWLGQEWAKQHTEMAGNRRWPAGTVSPCQIRPVPDQDAPTTPLKVETRVRTPLGLPGETHHRRTRLHPGKGADTGTQDTPKRRSKHADQAGPLVSRPAFVPQTTSPRHGAGRGLSPPAAPRRRHSLPSPVVLASPVPRDDTAFEGRPPDTHGTAIVPATLLLPDYC